MRLLEYEAKQLLAAHGMPIPKGQLVTSVNQEPLLPLPLILKAQIPIGGRGKAGGVKPVYTKGEFHDAASELLSSRILGHQARTVLAEHMLEIKRELYLAIVVDRVNRNLTLLAHREGGVEIETAAQNDEMLRIALDEKPDDHTHQQLLEYFNLTENFRQALGTIVNDLWATITREDALLVEINPLIVTGHDQLVCADAKIELDDSAAFRHNWNFEHQPSSNQFVIINEQGTIGSMANGAGLAMATVDAIQSAGGAPANFLDVGGGSDAYSMVMAFRDISELPNIRAIVVNIFGGITRCDEVAEAIVMARDSVPNLPPLFIRLTGTNETEGKAILENAGLSTLLDLKSCVQDAMTEAA